MPNRAQPVFGRSYLCIANQSNSMKKPNAALTKIVADAKKIQAKSPRKAWKTCISEASAKYRKSKKS
jgi:hypothetical protein